jgi:internalin A
VAPSSGRIPAIEIDKIKRSRRCDLSYQERHDIPPEISRLSALRQLWMEHNQLTVLPPAIGQLTSLQDLRLGGNRLTTLPPSIGELTSLRELRLENNRLTALPPSIGQLVQLEELWLDGNLLAALPPEIGQLTQLRELRLEGNLLAALPPEIGQLTQLRELRLEGNLLAALPPEIGQLVGLKGLWLGVNELTALPPEIGRLTNLERLWLTLNQLADLPPQISRLTNLKELWVERNRLAAVPREIGQLVELLELRLARNQLVAVPREIGELPKLQWLTLDGNKLTELPPQLAGPLSRGLALKVGGNPLREPIAQLAERSPDMLAAYLFSLNRDKPLYEAKLIVIGEGNVGKSSLVAALHGAPFISDRSTTHGIEVTPLTLRDPSLDAELTVRTWDFGGQEAYRITQQFFFSRGAVYLVVWHAREGQEQNEVEGWIRRIRLRVGDDARVLIVATHSDERSPELDYPRLSQAFPKLLAGSFAVDSQTGHGIGELREHIASEIARLPQMGQVISARWVVVRDEITSLSMSAPLIGFEEFRRICLQHGVDGDIVETLATFLHDLGWIVYYGDDEGLRDVVLLNPEMLTKVVSRILEDSETRRADGVLDHARLAAIWQDPVSGVAYPPEYHPYFLRLMEKFDVSYRLPGEHQSLVAQMVPYGRPELPWDFATPPVDGVRRLGLVCRLSEPVPGLMAWLTVQHQRSSTGRHWRTGLFLRHPIATYASEALLELRPNDQLSFEVRAPSPEYFFHVIRNSVEGLLVRRWPGVSYELLVPCRTVANGTRCLNLTPIEGLLGYQAAGETHYRCMTCMVKREISALLAPAGSADQPWQVQLERLHEGLLSTRGGTGGAQSLAADAADMMRRVLQLASQDVTDCPRLFTLTPHYRPGAYRLVLWCEHPGYWHPWSAATYETDRANERLCHIGPYARVVFEVLRVVLAVTTLIGSDSRVREDVQLMESVVKGLPDVPADALEDAAAGTLAPAQAQASRALRALLYDLDQARGFGNLRRVLSPSGDFLWVCPEHYSAYDPGLPILPAP